jgi:hypothetical protein
MPLTPDQIAEIDAYLASKITKVRIPELPPNTTYGDLSLLDRSPIWMNAVNKTVWVDQLTLKALLTTGGSGTIAPVLRGDTIPHVVTLAEAGGNTVLIPEIAGKTFFLRLEGRPVLPPEFEILNAGGFKMNDVGGSPYVLAEGQLFDLQVYELMSTTTGTPAALSSSYVVGKVLVSSNTTLNGVNHANKIIQLRGGSTKVVLTLPDIALTPENAILIIEATITNDWQTKVQTQGGQFVYMNNTSYGSLFVAKGEVLILFRDTDGWYVINEFAKNYLGLARPIPAYGLDLNEAYCDGSLVNRDDFPREWERANAYSNSIVDEVDWAANPGCYSRGDGIITFRRPDLRNMFLRGVKTIGGTDTERALNAPGGIQQDSIEKFWPGTPTKPVILQVDGTQTVVTNDPDGTLVQPNVVTPLAIDKTLFSSETRPVNSGVVWVVKY